MANDLLPDIMATICEFDCVVLNCIAMDDTLEGLVTLTKDFSPVNERTNVAKKITLKKFEGGVFNDLVHEKFHTIIKFVFEVQ